MEHDQEKDKLGQQIAQIVGKTGKSAEAVEYDMRIKDALAVLQQEVPNIQEIFHSSKQWQQQANKPNSGVIVVTGNRSNTDKGNA